jgi:hypothetical protein
VVNVVGMRHVRGNDWYKVEFDSHAYTCCVTGNALVVNDTMKTVEVSTFRQSLGTMSKVQIVSAVMAYEVKHCLLGLMQLRLNDIVINE